MKIAILTLLLSSNYGGILQAYALQTILERMGHTVEVLQRPPSVYDNLQHKRWMMPFVYIKRAIYKLLINRSSNIFIERDIFKGEKIYGKFTHQFIKRYIKARYINDILMLKYNEYDAFVVGSDQVWRKPYFYINWQTHIENAFLAFSNDLDVKRVSYAASFGMDNISEYSPIDIAKSRDAIRRFDAVSVRENSGVDICKAKFDVIATHVLDPTMLLSKEDYIDLINKTSEKNIGSEGDMLCYILDESKFKTNVIQKLKSDFNLNPFYAYAPQPNKWKPGDQFIQPPIEKWLLGFKDAKLVVTDSFHACVFSIIFNKPFIAIGNAERGMSRFKSLLAMFNQEYRLIIPEEENPRGKVNLSNVEFLMSKPNCKERLEYFRNISLDYLNTSLN